MKKALIILAAIFFVSCTQKELYKDAWVSSIFEDKKCDLPCWENITPGETTWENAYDALQNNELVFDVIREKDAEGEKSAHIAWNFNPSLSGELHDRGMMEIYLDTTVVKNIHLILDKSELTIEEIFDVYGHPDKFHISSPISLTKKCYVYLIFDKLNTIVASISKCGTEGDSKYVIFNDNDLVIAIQFHDDNSFSELLNLINDKVRPWNGSGKQYE